MSERRSEPRVPDSGAGAHSALPCGCQPLALRLSHGLAQCHSGAWRPGCSQLVQTTCHLPGFWLWPQRCQLDPGCVGLLACPAATCPADRAITVALVPEKAYIPGSSPGHLQWNFSYNNWTGFLFLCLHWSKRHALEFPRQVQVCVRVCVLCLLLMLLVTRS